MTIKYFDTKKVILEDQYKCIEVLRGQQKEGL